jgi:hypothetical protein
MGSIWKPKYLNKKSGETRESSIYWISYSRNGIQIRESARTSDIEEATKYLDLHEENSNLPPRRYQTLPGEKTDAKIPISLAFCASQLRGMEAKKQHVVYFLTLTGEIVYVGQTLDLIQRLAVHRTDKEFDNMFYIPVKKDIARTVEQILIKIFRPKFNRMHNKNEQAIK